MLLFCVNHLSQNNELIYDKHQHRCYLLIHKNGTRSLINLAKNSPERFLHFLGNDSTQFLQQHNITELTVFVRDPIERFFSGLVTQSKIYKFDIEAVLDLWQHDPVPRIYMFDDHTIPQFWYLRRATKIPGLRFNIMPLNHLSTLYPDSKKINVGKKFDFSDISANIMNKIDYYLTEDVVLYSQFQNKTVELESIVSQIRLEKTFVEEYRSYYNSLTYL